MREIKFRGLYECEDGTKEWVYGYLGKCDYKFIIEDNQGLGTFIDENSKAVIKFKWVKWRD